MSFDVNNIGPRKQPAILGAQTMKNNGGGGNLGYFYNERKRKDEEYKEDESADCFIHEDEDVYGRNSNMSFWEKLRRFFFGK
jgi:hypothetical protein